MLILISTVSAKKKTNINGVEWFMNLEFLRRIVGGQEVSRQGTEQFKNKIILIAESQHRNLVFNLPDEKFVVNLVSCDVVRNRKTFSLHANTVRNT